MISLSSHILDTSRGLPAAGIPVSLFSEPAGQPLATITTNDDGRITSDAWALSELPAGTYRLRFAITDYQQQHYGSVFYPYVDVTVTLDDGHYHIPLLLSPYGYSTYRGS